MKVISGYLGPDLKVEGDVKSKDAIRIDGVYVGTVNSEQEVTIGASGEVEGEIHAPVIRVSGRVRGRLEAGRLLEVLAEARVEGDLLAPPGGLSMDMGGCFEGNFIPISLVQEQDDNISES